MNAIVMKTNSMDGNKVVTLPAMSDYLTIARHLYPNAEMFNLYHCVHIELKEALNALFDLGMASVIINDHFITATMDDRGVVRWSVDNVTYVTGDLFPEEDDYKNLENNASQAWSRVFTAWMCEEHAEKDFVELISHFGGIKMENYVPDVNLNTLYSEVLFATVRSEKSGATELSLPVRLHNAEILAELSNIDNTGFVFKVSHPMMGFRTIVNMGGMFPSIENMNAYCKSSETF